MRGRLVIPMAGEGRRFREMGYGVSKPLIPVKGIPMVARVLACLPVPEQTILMARVVDREAIEAAQPLLPRCEIEDVYYPTAGPAGTVVLSEEHRPTVPTWKPMMVADCDTWVDWDFMHFQRWLDREKPDAAMVVTRADGDQYSYAATKPGGQVRRVAEKEQISETACCGIWWWRTAEIGYGYLNRMIRAGERVNGEFYIAPSFNAMIDQGFRVLAYPVPRLYSMGTPEDLKATLDSGIFGHKE